MIDTHFRKRRTRPHTLDLNKYPYSSKRLASIEVTYRSVLVKVSGSSLEIKNFFIFDFVLIINEK